MSNSSVVVQLAINVRQYESYYSGAVSDVVATAVDGRTIRFPANILQAFVTHEGVHGVFELRYDDEHKFVEIVRLK